MRENKEQEEEEEDVILTVTRMHDSETNLACILAVPVGMAKKSKGKQDHEDT